MCKSTLGKSIVRLEDITSGEIKINGVNITQLNGEKLREARFSNDISRSLCFIKSNANGWRYNRRTIAKLSYSR